MKKLLLTLLFLFSILQGYTRDDGEVDAIKIAYIQMDILMDELDICKELQHKLAIDAQLLESEYTSNDKAFQKELAEFNDKAGKGLYTQEQAEQVYARLQKTENDLQLIREGLVADMAEEHAYLAAKIRYMFTEYIAKYNETEKYSLILNSTNDNMNVIYALPSMDITQEIIKGMNEEYAKQ